jgi:RHS repeat-associated protein
MMTSAACSKQHTQYRSRSTGKERDAESGNDYFGVRYYGSSMGRFLSPDPSQLYYANPLNPQSLNLYSYGWNNPLTNIDPTGMDCVKDNGNGSVSYNSGDCANENEDAANHEYYINCDGCTSGATGANLDQATGDLYLTTTTTDSLGNSVETPLAGTTVQGFASPDPTALTTNVQVSGGAAGSVTMSGYGIGLLAYFPYANLSLPPATIRDPNAPPALPKLKGKDKRLCLWGQMTNEMMGGEGGPSDSTDTAPGRGGAAAIPFHTTTRGGKPVTRQMGVSESGDATLGGVQTLWDYAWADAACFAN